MKKELKIYVAGHKGMVGSAICRLLDINNYKNIITAPSSQLDLTNQNDVKKFICSKKPNVIINAAAKVGGILANRDYPYQFLMDNMKIQNNLIDEALKNNVEKFIFLGSSCIYPKFSPQPIKEEYLLSGHLESTNEWYAIAKISGVKACQAIREQYSKDFISLMPSNLYGINDNFDLKTSHVLPAMIRKFHEAKMNNSHVELWGSGKPLREFLFVDDLAEAVIFTIENKLKKHIYNVGSGVDITIRDLSKKIKNIVGYKGKIIWKDNMPDGTPKKLMDISRLKKEGWKAKTNIDRGIKITYNWFLKNENNYRKLNFYEE